MDLTLYVVPKHAIIRILLLVPTCLNATVVNTCSGLGYGYCDGGVVTTFLNAVGEESMSDETKYQELYMAITELLIILSVQQRTSPANLNYLTQT